MKKLAIPAVLTAMCLSACQNYEGHSAVSGTISNAEGLKVYMDQHILGSGIQTVDSTKVDADGTFVLHGAIQHEPTFYDVRLSNGKSFSVLLDSAQQLSLKADASRALMVGGIEFESSPRNEDLQAVMLGSAAIRDAIQQKQPVDSILQSIAAYKETIRAMAYKDPQSMVGYYAVLQTISGSRIFDVMNHKDHQLYSMVATSLNIAYPSSEQVKYLCDLVLSARAQQHLNAKRDSLIKSAEVVESPDLVLPDIQGNMHKLSETRGNYVILSFWVSGDKNSRAANRQMAKIYNKYADRGLKIYSVNFDQSKVLWEAASAEDKISWTNVSDGLVTPSQAALLYNVSNVPSNYVIDPKGRLVGKDLFGTRLDEKMQDIFK